MAADAQLDAFLYFGKSLNNGKPTHINGETGDAIESQSDSEYGKSMAVQGYSIGFTHEMDHTEETDNQSDGTQSHEPEINTITVTKLVDAASPQLLRALWEGTTYKDAWISQRKAGGVKGRSGDYFWQIELQEVSIQNLTWSADGGGQTTESVTLYANKGVYVQYFRQKHTGELEPSPIHYETPAKHRHNKKNGAGNGSDGDLDPSQKQAVIKDVIKQLELKYPRIKSLR